MTLFDELGVIFEDEYSVDLFPIDGQPALSPVRLALTTLLQFKVWLTEKAASNCSGLSNLSNLLDSLAPVT